MLDTMINRGVYHPFSAAQTTHRFGSSGAVSTTTDENHQSITSEEKNRNGQDHPSAFTDKLELSREAQEIRELQMRDREVRAHEAAHAVAGGSYAGSPSYIYERGSDGRTYAVGGSVSIDISPIQGDPLATLQKAEQVRAAALAPAQPSAQDIKVAQKAQAMAAAARNEISQEQMKERAELLDQEQNPVSGFSMEQGVSPYVQGISNPGPARLEAYG